jgi:predicted  nucleic acid-binding Zn ribbon protein
MECSSPLELCGASNNSLTLLRDQNGGVLRHKKLPLPLFCGETSSMVLANIKFGRSGKQSRRELEELVETYLAHLLRQGQLCTEYFFAWTDGILNAYVHIPSPNAHALRHHSSYGKKSLAEVKKVFGQNPEWKLLESGKGKWSSTWRRAPFLYLFTHAFDDEPPFSRGDNGKQIPAYLFSIPRLENIYSWQCSYREHDRVWLGSGALELPAYRQLADPSSELSEDGRDLCRQIEEITNIPTYYFLMRHWGRRQNEDARKCPGCGRSWRTEYTTEKRTCFWQFEFQCHSCRLVSHGGVSFDNERHAAIGEFKTANQKTKK